MNINMAFTQSERAMNHTFSNPQAHVVGQLVRILLLSTWLITSALPQIRNLLKNSIDQPSVKSGFEELQRRKHKYFFSFQYLNDKRILEAIFGWVTLTKYN